MFFGAFRTDAMAERGIPIPPIRIRYPNPQLEMEDGFFEILPGHGQKQQIDQGGRQNESGRTGGAENEPRAPEAPE